MNREYAKMCVGPGWQGLVNELFDFAEKENFQVTEVKEKFGSLRIYTDFLSEEQDKVLAELENRSFTMCEGCGVAAEAKTVRGWITVLCASCRSINDAL